ncbi:acetyl/propionyl/methylcrotonyl-CoA carboxylase subunit alpha [Aeromicrobium sp. CF3.5]|uniref:acetyl/propionyl/methylcrotonyl-CoA carboxylase subunit alpha n=1 Tax=Aeromicrobium sp. CF3.5 TaxID=3373078 RepID=UPI003EE6C8A0
MSRAMIFETVLVANRGEIALRIMRTCRRLGVRSVAVFTDIDAHAPHVRAADAAVRIESYLDVDEVVSAAVSSGAQALHPGYGFLSERSEFAAAVVDAGLVMVGPTAEVMDQMGRKDAAREIAIAAGVPVVPRGEDAGFPMLVKAAAGGGGKGMRVVRAADDLDESIAAAKREAASAFGDDTMLLEKYVEHGRHIEVQILADHHGHVIHLFERDCSTQRRHQKVIEEAPAPTIDEATRASITRAAVDLAGHVGYTNAGTVEFLLDADTGEAYFLEMNTRLQVEHPVTELICAGPAGEIDLVEHQLRIAAGQPLALGQDDVRLRGHAMEARVYAEDSFGGFLPQAGTADLVRWPKHARVDAALESGQVVSTSYDPMLGKIIVRGPDRESARRALVAALDDTAILGLTTNTGFLRALAASPEFTDCTIDTAWLDTAVLPRPDADGPRAVAAWFVAAQAARSHDAFGSDGFRLGAPVASTRVRLDRDLLVDRTAGTVRDDDQTWAVRLVASDGALLVVDVDGTRVRATVQALPNGVEVVVHGERHVFAAPDRLGSAAAVGDGDITAPMPGTVLDVRVAVGDTVAAGDVLGTLEAMKMELALTAPFDGIVETVAALPGSQVTMAAPLFTITADESRRPADESQGTGS